MNYPRSGGPASAQGVLRSRAQDFVVEERLGFEPDGNGEHVLLHIEKVDANTAWVADQLARFAGVRPRDVGFAGRKDRHAVARQWFSIWLPGAQDPDFKACVIEGVTILSCTRHGRKLRPGALVGNRFDIVIRELSGDRAELQERLVTAAEHGVPNYFGAQRFGRNGANLSRARDWFAGRLRLHGTQRSMALSAARSALFNDVLAARIEARNWVNALRGDALNLEGRGGFFVCEQPDDEIKSRIACGELHVTGPLWGTGDQVVKADAAALETRVAGHESELLAGVCKARLRQERRALRVMPRSLHWQMDETTLRLQFELPSGTFATSLLAEVLELRAPESASDKPRA